MAHKGDMTLTQKLSELGYPLNTRTEALESLYGYPSMRLQSFLHWFVNGLDAKTCALTANFTPEDLMLLNLSEILTGEALEAKENEVVGDENDSAEEVEDEDVLQEDIDHLEQLIAVEMKKQSVLHHAVENKRAECAALNEENILQDEPMDESSLGDAVDNLLSNLDQENNKFKLAFLAPQTCGFLAVQEDKILDAIQNVLVNGPRKRSSSIGSTTLETIPESPSHSSQVRWLHESLLKEMPMVNATKEREYVLSSVEFNRLVKAFPKGEIYALNSSLEMAKRKAMHMYRHQQSQHVLDRCRLMPSNVLTKNYQELTQRTTELQQQTQRILTHILPQRLEQLGRLQMTSVVLGDYMGKVTRQSKYLNQQDEVTGAESIGVLLSQLLTFEKGQMASIQADLQGLKSNIDNHSIALARRMQTRPFGLPDISSESKLLIDLIQSVLGPTTGSLDEQCRAHASQMEQLESIRSNIRDEYRLALQKQLNIITELKESLNAMELDTYQAVETLEVKKNQINRGITAATKKFQEYENILLHKKKSKF
ncbi:hypothetical protein THRCLA_02817 [Thraustotheca clavata]|uniref:HAUS augmin-like complex subunit 3 N-terminal domain-containing protein n=1 Tax=Thraustotheca clavata TaxID=74557 RepID=A0A1W0A4M8_9STRA|nr:hypothetical protein THRCLA_02817 [Thraustotheca clavata]